MTAPSLESGLSLLLDEQEVPLESEVFGPGLDVSLPLTEVLVRHEVKWSGKLPTGECTLVSSLESWMLVSTSLSLESSLETELVSATDLEEFVLALSPESWLLLSDVLPLESELWTELFPDIELIIDQCSL